MEDKEKLLRQIKQLKSELTFDFDKKAMDDLEEAIKKALPKTELLKMDVIKEFIDLMKIKIKQCNSELLENRELPEDERKRVFDRRDVWQWVINFFEESQRTVESVGNRIKEELKEE